MFVTTRIRSAVRFMSLGNAVARAYYKNDLGRCGARPRPMLAHSADNTKGVQHQEKERPAIGEPSIASSYRRSFIGVSEMSRAIH